MDSGAERQSWLERTLPPRSARRALTLTAITLGTLIGALHYEVGRIKDSQEAGIGQVKDEIGTQSRGIKDPLLQTVGEAKDAMEKGQQKLDICQRVADQFGVDVSSDPNHQPTTTTTALPPQQELAVVPTTTTP